MLKRKNHLETMRENQYHCSRSGSRIHEKYSNSPLHSSCTPACSNKVTDGREETPDYRCRHRSNSDSSEGLRHHRFRTPKLRPSRAVGRFFCACPRELCVGEDEYDRIWVSPPKTVPFRRQKNQRAALRDHPRDGNDVCEWS